MTDEAIVQCHVVQYCDWHKIPVFHIPNGGKRNRKEAANLKRQGVRAGVPDLCIPVAKGSYHGLYIEFKSPEEKPSKDQKELLQGLQEAGYFACVIDRLDAAIKITQSYLNLPEVNMLYLLIDKYGQETANKCMLGEGMAYEV